MPQSDTLRSVLAVHLDMTSVRFHPTTRDDVKVLETVDVEVHGAVERGEKMGDVGHRFNPGRPGALVLHEGHPEQLKYVWNPFDGMAQDENEDNS